MTREAVLGSLGFAPCLSGSAIPDMLLSSPACLHGLGTSCSRGSLWCCGTSWSTHMPGRNIIREKCKWFPLLVYNCTQRSIEGGQDSGDTSLRTTSDGLRQGAVPRGAQLSTARSCPSSAPLQWQSASQTSSEESKISGCQATAKGSFQGSAEITGDVATIFP